MLELEVRRHHCHTLHILGEKNAPNLERCYSVYSILRDKYDTEANQAAKVYEAERRELRQTALSGSLDELEDCSRSVRRAVSRRSHLVECSVSMTTKTVFPISFYQARTDKADGPVE